MPFLRVSWTSGIDGDLASQLYSRRCLSTVSRRGWLERATDTTPPRRFQGHPYLNCYSSISGDFFKPQPARQRYGTYGPSWVANEYFPEIRRGSHNAFAPLVLKRRDWHGGNEHRADISIRLSHTYERLPILSDSVLPQILPHRVRHWPSTV